MSWGGDSVKRVTTVKYEDVEPNPRRAHQSRCGTVSACHPGLPWQDGRQTQGNGARDTYEGASSAVHGGLMKSSCLKQGKKQGQHPRSNTVLHTDTVAHNTQKRNYVCHVKKN